MQEKIKFIISYIPAWGFYYLGDITSKLMHTTDFMVIIYPMYNHFMRWSLFFSDWGNIGVWVDG